MSKERVLLGFRGFGFLVLAAVVGCGGGNDGGGGGDDDDSNAGAGDQGGTSGSSGSGGSNNGGTDNGGTDNGGSSGASTGGKGGTTGKGGSGGSATGATGPALDRIEEACDADCAEQYALDCTPPNTNELTCRSQCAAQTGQLGDFCLAEYAAVVECRAEGGYECLTTYPSPRATCGSEQLALRECMANLGCKRSCQKSVEDSCTSLSLDDCIDACIAKGEDLPTSCVYSWDSIAMCKVQAGATCADGELTTPATCAHNVMYLAECISDESMDMCDGWCFAANTLGCGGDDCAADCAARAADPTCGTAFNDMLDCALFFDDAACSGDMLLGNSSCESDATAYTTCLAGGTGM